MLVFMGDKTRANTQSIAAVFDQNNYLFWLASWPMLVPDLAANKRELTLINCLKVAAFMSNYW